MRRATLLLLAGGLFGLFGTALAEDDGSEGGKRRPKKKQVQAEEDEDKDQVVGKTEDGKKIVRRAPTVDHDSSEAMRQGKRGSVVVEAGFAIGAMPTSGIAGGYYLRANDIAELSHVSGSYDFLFIKVSGSLTEARLKHFWGNSFYTNLGLGQRKLEFKATLSPLTGNDDISSSLTVTTLGASIGIGNRWQWESFTMGCDWVGAFIPISSTGTTEVKDGGVDITDKKRLEDDANELGKTSSDQLLRFYLGLSF